MSKGSRQGLWKESLDKENESSIKTFSRVSTKDSTRVVTTLVAHYKIELLQTDFKTTFLNGDLKEDIYMAQPEGFVMEGKEHLAYHIKISLYGLKQASRECYLKLGKIIETFGFMEMSWTTAYMLNLKAVGSQL